MENEMESRESRDSREIKRRNMEKEYEKWSQTQLYEEKTYANSLKRTNELLHSINLKLTVIVFVFVFIPLVWAIFFN